MFTDLHVKTKGSTLGAYRSDSNWEKKYTNLVLIVHQLKSTKELQ